MGKSWDLFRATTSAYTSTSGTQPEIYLSHSNRDAIKKYGGIRDFVPKWGGQFSRPNNFDIYLGFEGLGVGR